MTGDAVLALYEHYHQTVYRMAYAILGNRADAEDAVQTVFMKLLSVTAAPQPGKERAWLLRITVNVCRDALRRASYRQTEELDESIPAMPREDSALLEAVQALPERYRITLHLHYYEGYSQQECAELLGVSTSAVSMRLSRARGILRRSLEGDEL